MRVPDIIFLNGATSAGKTSIAKGLQARLPALFLHFGVDHMLRKCPPQWMETAEGFQLVRLPNGEMPIRLGEGARQVLRGWRRMVRAGVDEGLRFIIDDVLFDETLLPGWMAALD